MSIQAVAWALDQDIRKPLLKLILVSLANYADKTTGFCWPTMRTLAAKSSCARETVVRKMPLLEEGGYVRKIADNDGRSHYYQLLMPGCNPDAHPPSRGSGRHPSKRRPITPGCDPAITTNNLHSSITSPKPPSVPAPRGYKAIREEVDAAHASVIQAAIVSRLGKGDSQHGWLLFGWLSDVERDQLTARQRLGRLTDASINNLLLDIRRRRVNA